MEAALNKGDYFRLRNELSFQRRFWPTALVMLADIGMLVLAFWLVANGGWLAYLVAQLLFVLVFFHNFAILHECGHGNCAKSERINSITGLYASIFCFMPYFPWKYIHAEHHTWAGNVERDPTLDLVRKYEESKKIKNFVIRTAWRTWIPLMALMQHVVFWSYPVQQWLKGRLRGVRLARSVFSVLVLFVTYASLAWLLPQYFNLTTFGPALVIYLVVVELINFPHHLGTALFETTGGHGHSHKLPLWEQGAVTRSCFYPRFFADLLLLNFNFHIEHHLFPDLPWFRLRKARDLSLTALGESYQQSVGISWNLQNRSKDAADVFLRDASGKAHRRLSENMAAAACDAEYEQLLDDVGLADGRQESPLENTNPNRGTTASFRQPNPAR